MMQDSTSKFVQHVRSHLAEYGWKLIFGKGLNVNCEGIRIAGYFNTSRKEIRVARGNGKWLWTLLHEYSHFVLWLEQSARDERQDDRATHIVADYTTGSRRYSRRQLDWAFRRVRTYERETERRAIELALRHRLRIGVKRYIRAANCYIYLYHMMREFPTWNWRRDPFNNSTIQKVMPSSFRRKAHLTIPTAVRRVLEPVFQS